MSIFTVLYIRSVWIIYYLLQAFTLKHNYSYPLSLSHNNHHFIFCFDRFSFSRFIYTWYYIILLFLCWLISPSIMLSRSIHDANEGCLPFSWHYNIPLCLCIVQHIFLSIDGYLGFPHNLDTVKNGAVNMRVYVSLRYPIE